MDLSLSPPRLDAASLRSQAKNLSRNGLSDDSVARIADRLRQLHVRVTALPGTGFLLRPAAFEVRCLDLTGNKAATKGRTARPQPTMNCAMLRHRVRCRCRMRPRGIGSLSLELLGAVSRDLSCRQRDSGGGRAGRTWPLLCRCFGGFFTRTKQAGSGEENPVSSFLRCLYNHPNYPRKTRRAHASIEYGKTHKTIAPPHLSTAPPTSQFRRRRLDPPSRSPPGRAPEPPKTKHR